MKKNCTLAEILSDSSTVVNEEENKNQEGGNPAVSCCRGGQAVEQHLIMGNQAE